MGEYVRLIREPSNPVSASEIIYTLQSAANFTRWLLLSFKARRSHIDARNINIIIPHIFAADLHGGLLGIVKILLRRLKADLI